MNLERESRRGLARQETAHAAEALRRRVRLGAVSVRRFRAEQTGKSMGRSPVRDVFLAARRLNRTLRRLAQVPDTELTMPPELTRVLRRSARLIERRLKG
jgi:hypothetical protein